MKLVITVRMHLRQQLANRYCYCCCGRSAADAKAGCECNPEQTRCQYVHAMWYIQYTRICYIGSTLECISFFVFLGVTAVRYSSMIQQYVHTYKVIRQELAAESLQCWVVSHTLMPFYNTCHTHKVEIS